MSTGLYSGVSGLALGTGLYKGAQGLWGGSSGLIDQFGATLSLNFLTNTTLDPRITFSRTTNATLVDSTGRVTYAPNNLVLRSEEFENAAWTKTASTITVNASVAPNGTTTADKLVENTAASTGHFIQPSPSPTSPGVSVGQFFIYSVYAKAGERTFIQLIGTGTGPSGGPVLAGFDLTNGTAGTPSATVTSTITDVGDGWYRCSMAFPISTAGIGTYQIRLALNSVATASSYTGDGTSGLFIWGAQFEQVTYQTLPSTYVQTVASAYYGPRFDYDPVTLASRGLLIEEQRVNLLLYSAELDNAAWTKAGSTITANATTSPDGTTNADKLVENTAATTQHRVQQAATTVSGTSYTYTVYLKAGERTVVTMRAIGTATIAGCTINLTAGTISAITGTATITNAGNGWYRVSVTGTADSTTTTCYVNLSDGTSITYTGDGVSGAFVWGAQLEAGAFATSYIPTVASTVTRAADSASMTGTNFSSWYNASEGTFVASASTYSTASDKGVYATSDGTNNNRIYLVVSTSADHIVTVSSAQQANITIAGAVTNNTVFRDAFAYRENDISAATNGVLGTPDTLATLPVVDQFRLGARSDGNLRLNGHIRTFTYYPQRLADAQLQALSA